MAAQPVSVQMRSSKTLFKLLACLAVFCLLAPVTLAQKEKKKKKDANATADTHTTIPMGDEQQIDYKISEMLGAWQLGDVDRLHQTYADDAVFVSGLWAPPVFGWANYLPLYQQQRQRMQQVRMDRSNTFIKVSGTVGWACYQWDFGGTVDGQAATTRGQTTLVLEKRSDHWVIVHNHTSMTQGTPTLATVPAAPGGATPAGTPQPQPGRPPTS
jgi:ketosteroid isomerase-like protein